MGEQRNAAARPGRLVEVLSLARHFAAARGGSDVRRRVGFVVGVAVAAVAPAALVAAAAAALVTAAAASAALAAAAAAALTAAAASWVVGVVTGAAKVARHAAACRRLATPLPPPWPPGCPAASAWPSSLSLTSPLLLLLLLLLLDALFRIADRARG